MAYLLVMKQGSTPSLVSVDPITGVPTGDLAETALDTIPGYAGLSELTAFPGSEQYFVVEGRNQLGEVITGAVGTADLVPHPMLGAVNLGVPDDEDGFMGSKGTHLSVSNGSEYVATVENYGFSSLIFTVTPLDGAGGFTTNLGPTNWAPNAPVFSRDASLVHVRVGNGVDATTTKVFVFDTATGVEVYSASVPYIDVSWLGTHNGVDALYYSSGYSGNPAVFVVDLYGPNQGVEVELPVYSNPVTYAQSRIIGSPHTGSPVYPIGMSSGSLVLWDELSNGSFLIQNVPVTGQSDDLVVGVVSGSQWHFLISGVGGYRVVTTDLFGGAANVGAIIPSSVGVRPLAVPPEQRGAFWTAFNMSEELV